MSSNIEVQRVCQFCGAEFTAKTTVTKYCSHQCSSRAHKQRKREEKVGVTNKSTSVQLSSIESANLKSREFLSVPQAGKLIGVSRFTIYRYLHDNILKCVKMRGKTFIRRQDIETLFDNAAEYKIRERKEPQPITEFYSMKEITESFGIKETWAYKMIKTKNIPKVSYRGRTVYSKPHCDKVFSKPESVITEWYTVEEAITKYSFLQFLYDLNVVCYKQLTKDGELFWSWSYWEKTNSNISPKVKEGETYAIHYGLQKAFNTGKQFVKRRTINRKK